MNQEQALQAVRELLPDIAEGIKLERVHSIGVKLGAMDKFIVWNHANKAFQILAQSEHSWNHAVALVHAAVVILQYADPDTSAVDEPSLMEQE